MENHAHDLREVSCKILLVNPERTKALLMYHPNKVAYGMPGGHVEAGEELLETALRELQEETGIVDIAIEPRGFWLHGGDAKIILGYSGVLAFDERQWPQGDHNEYAIWVDATDIPTIKIDEGYRQFALSELSRSLGQS